MYSVIPNFPTKLLNTSDLFFSGGERTEEGREESVVNVDRFLHLFDLGVCLGGGVGGRKSSSLSYSNCLSLFDNDSFSFFGVLGVRLVGVKGLFFATVVEAAPAAAAAVSVYKK